MFNSILAISIGASIGAVGRWLLSLWLNKVFLFIPLGTLLANLVGGYLIGVAFALFANHPSWPAEWRLLVITGFLGGLTTFSTFSIETVSLLQQEKWLWAAMQISLHVLGSLVMTLMGLATVSYLRQ
ncbi:MAG TPA: fluoride efflux transporter CrcB [Agitococcus sp.]|nr:fluoride efflux transporter CrcB [Agitococcus sp.]HMV60162.1 fluoride efflux transporter CrcB [Agitococcus sp.]HMY81656.1 fluoride efflux transporter CrcB [Agitococcus sp.]HNA20281.1 fluoride efflux transporter CrcB [Agitococcus sp.]HNC02511.1 fluoride efflux transporter CrcB [Agitococcus sp.]